MTVGSDVKSCYITIKQAAANLQELSLASTSEENADVYDQGHQLLEEIKQDLHQQVLFLAREELQYK